MKTETCGKCGTIFSWDNKALFGGSPESEWFSYLCPSCSQEKAARARHDEHEKAADRRTKDIVDAARYSSMNPTSVSIPNIDTSETNCQRDVRKWREKLELAEKRGDKKTISSILSEVMQHPKARHWMSWDKSKINVFDSFTEQAALSLIVKYGSEDDIARAAEYGNGKQDESRAARLNDSLNKYYAFAYVLGAPWICCKLCVWILAMFGQASWVENWPNVFLLVPVLNMPVVAVFIFQCFWYTKGIAAIISILIAFGVPTALFAKVLAKPKLDEWHRIKW